ncbi:MAG: FliH/SctL family protein, partial [Congregibacter sp.]|nr:FliH/SctL family protein [Congregibacter sp.]
MILSNPADANTDDRWARAVPNVLSQRGAGSSPAAAAAAPAAVDVRAERQKGYDAGYAEGLAAGRAQAQGLVAQMNVLLSAMAAPFTDSDAVLLRELLLLTERVARAVIRRELEAGIDIEQVLADALDALGSVSIPVQLTLNPLDAAVCKDLGLLPNERFELRENSALQRGGLQLRAGHSFVDASVESRIEAALASLRADAGLPEDDGVDDPAAGQ